MHENCFMLLGRKGGVHILAMVVVVMYVKYVRVGAREWLCTLFVFLCLAVAKQGNVSRIPYYYRPGNIMDMPL